MIVDASVILQAFFPDEAQAQAQALVRDHVLGRLHLEAPTLLLYEICNAVWQAERRRRISPQQAEDVLAAVRGVGIQLRSLGWGEMLPLARRFNRSAYDAAYLALAQASSQPLITGDERLFHAVHAQLEWVQWIGDYPAQPD